MLNRKDLDAVFVITPLFTHFGIACDVMQSGRHVFCEKCLVFKPEEVHELRGLNGAASETDPADGSATAL